MYLYNRQVGLTLGKQGNTHLCRNLVRWEQLRGSEPQDNREDEDALDRVITLRGRFSWLEIPIQEQSCVLTHSLALWRDVDSTHTLYIDLCISNICNWYLLNLLWKTARRKETVKGRKQFSSGKGRKCFWSHHSSGLVLLSLFFTYVTSFIADLWNSIPLLTWYKTRGAEIATLWKEAQDYL